MRFLTPLILCSGLMAQAVLTTTTTSAAASMTTVNIQVASTVGATPGLYAYVVDVNGQPGELIKINSVTGSTLVVTRGAGGLQRAHVSGAAVTIGPYQAFNTSNPNGACTSTEVIYTPWYNINTGIKYTCTAGAWTAINQGTGGSSYNQTIIVDTTTATQRANLKFASGTNVSLALTDNGTDTVVTVNGSGSSCEGTSSQRWLEWPLYRMVATAGSVQAIATIGSANQTMHWPWSSSCGRYVSSFKVYVSTVATGAAKIGFYDASGNLITSSCEIDTSGSAGYKSCDMGTPVLVPACPSGCTIAITATASTVRFDGLSIGEWFAPSMNTGGKVFIGLGTASSGGAGAIVMSPTRGTLTGATTSTGNPITMLIGN